MNNEVINKKLSIILPAYNEEKTLKFVLDNVIDIDLSELKLEKEIIIVDDGSFDGTKEILKSYENMDNIKIISHYINQGKGTAIRTGLNHSTGDIIIIQDADMEYDPSDYPKLVKPILEGKAKVVYGSRFMAKKFPKRMMVLNFLGNKFLTVLTNLLYRAKITDEATCYKVFDAQLLKSIKLICQEFEFCPEVTAKICKIKVPIYEVPISYSARSLKEGKKIGFVDAPRQGKIHPSRYNSPCKLQPLLHRYNSAIQDDNYQIKQKIPVLKNLS